MTEPHENNELSKMLTVDSSQDALKGVFKTKDDIDNYERVWHLSIYQPTWNELRSKVKVNAESVVVLSTQY